MNVQTTMTDQTTDRSSVRSLFDSELRPYFFLAGLQAIVSFLGALLVTTGLLG